MTRRRGGFTLVEALVGLALSLLVISAGVEFFALAQRAFFRLKAREEAGQAALAALDRMRIDLLHAGRGLAAEMAAGLVEAVQAGENELRTAALAKRLGLAAEAVPGTTHLELASAADIVAGDAVVLFDGRAGEARAVTSVEPGGVGLDRPLDGRYAPATASVALLETVAYFVDGPARILRRRVDATSAQPVLEGVRAADWTYDREARLARLRLEVDIEGAHPHEATVFVKNASLAAKISEHQAGKSGT
jgi:type II secretory pathway pseudopilin PulG